MSVSVGNALTVNGSGMGTGIDVDAMVASQMSILRIPEQSLKNEQTTLSTKSTVLNALNLGLSQLQTSIQAFTDINGSFNTKTATPSDSTMLTATASETASTGTHTVVINNLATTSSYVSHTALASGDTTFATGSFTVQVGSNTAATITVDSSNNTLNGLAKYINGQSLGVTASVITDASGSRLSLVSQTSGSAGDVTIDSGSNTTGLVFDKKVTGKNASATVDGIDIVSSSNNVSGVISGVTLNLLNANAGQTLTVSVNPDTSAMTSAISDFVTNYNTVINAINNQFSYDPTSGNDAPALFGDAALELVQQQLYDAVNYSISGNNGLVNLQSLGVAMNNDGTLTVNASKLNSAVANSPDSIVNFFQGSVSSWGYNFNTSLYKMTSPTSGALYVEASSITSQQSSLTSQINDWEARLAVQQTALITQYSNINTILQELPQTLSTIKSELGS